MPAKRIFVFFNFIILFSFSIGCSLPFVFQQKPIAEKGIIDLRKFNFAENVTELNGDWEFYWKELAYGSRSIPKTPSYFPVPGIWRDYDPNFTPEGYATYRLRVLCGYKYPNLKIRIPRLPGVYEVYFDDHKVYSNGFAGTGPLDTVFSEHPLMTNIVVPSEDFYITVTVSTFKGNYLKGGIRKPFQIGSGKAIDLEEKREEWREMILIVVIFSFGIYHVVFFFSYRKDPIPLYFTAFCFLVSGYSFVTSEIQFMALPDLSLDLRLRIKFFCEIAFFPTSFLMLRKMFPLQFNRKWIQIAIGTSTIFFFGIFALNERNIVLFYSWFMYFPPLYALILIIGTATTFKAKELFTGFVLAFTMMNDGIYGLYEIYALYPYSFPLGLIAFVALNSYIISSRFAEDLERAKEFAQLQIRYNEQLKLQAQERTRIASDIHDSIGSELTAILFELESKDKNDSTLKKLKSEVNHLISNVRDIVFLMHHQGNNQELVEEVIKRYGDRIQRTGTIEVKMEIEDVSNFIHLDQCLHVQKIFLEVASNILRHSEAKKIQISWKKEGKKLILKLTDDGKKFEINPEEVSGIGMSSIRMRSEKLGASYVFHFTDSENSFELNIPIS
ncbi:7TM diverse intracellular signaling [Leptospira weilii str. 2006001853]|uniref:histidine kinase n=2 Tax=Leptospira weilii TaxID=28184 RepID=A0A828Z660_9LEPT|nr:7TM diverse intracellular signaling domain-containing protein [Leptospira weilii]EMM73636.1 7TM diverse intracellular signaling [Leptospira weilii str. 2006001855]EKR65180.1 7TM diverse intracellular signaling [Leptospira weilii str. 2006001853]EMN44842.1 7TM diverse intracellular signaling [Leptospira weilii str. LNT 1234]MCL8267948.1 histidine kinase [Leptospira weilii]QDK22082.1 histidine kinase [Leptospira weilii]